MSLQDINCINPHILICGHIGEASCPPSGTDYGLRCVRWHEIELITWGEGEIITDGVSIPARKGNIFFRRPGMKVRGISPYQCYIIIFDIIYDPLKKDLYDNPRYFADDLSRDICRDGNFSGLDFPDVFKTSRLDEFVKLFKNTYNEWVNQTKDAPLFMKSLVMQILVKAYEEYSHEHTVRNINRSMQMNLPRIAAVKEYIHNNPGKWFSLAELAKHSGLSRNFFCKIFRDIVGETPVEYMNRQKITTAKKLLIETNCSIKEIACELGFQNDTYFYSMFKNKTGMTPMEFKHRQRIPYQTV